MATTANTNTDILGKILVAGMKGLRSRSNFAKLVNADYSADARDYGATVDIPYSTAKTASDVTPAETPPAPGATTSNIVQISLNRWKHVDFHLSDSDLAKINAGKHFLPTEVEEAFEAMANDVNAYVAGLYKRVYGFTGTSGTTPFGSGVEVLSAVNARKILNQQKCPKTRRYAILDDDADAAAIALPQFGDANRRGDAESKRTGDLGKIYNIDWRSDSEVQSHTAGTVGADMTVNGAHAAAASDRADSVSIESTSGGTLAEGDIITFAGDAQTYAVTALVTLAAGVAGAVAITPGLQSVLSGSEVVTKKASHVANMVFNRDCFGLAMRSPGENINKLYEMLGAKSVDVQAQKSIVDNETGLVARIEVLRQYKQTVFDLDWMYGAALIDARKGCRIAG